MPTPTKMNVHQNLSHYLKMLRNMKNLDKDNQDYVFDTYDYGIGCEDMSLQSKASMTIVKQLIIMSHETQQKQILENITNKGVKDIILANIKKVVDKYDILLQEYYDELDFKEKKYIGYMGW